MSEQPEHRRTKGRSPSYPGLSLPVAVERARMVYDLEGRHAAPITAITRHWGFKSPTTGPASVAYSALIKYGLLADEGSGLDRSAKLTELALDILLNPNHQPSTHRAALLPSIHREMWEEFGNSLPSDDNLRWRLVVQRGFTETGMRDFIREYRDTLAYAQLPETASIPSEAPPLAEEDVQDDTEHEPTPPRPRGPQRRGGSGMSTDMQAPDVQTFSVPLLGAPPVIVEGKFPVSEAEWTYFMAVLSAMKPGLVLPSESDS